MEAAFILAQQVLVIFALMAVGFVSAKKGWFSLLSAKNLSAFLLVIVMPVTLVRAMMRPFQPELLPSVWLAVLLGVVFHGVGLAAVCLLIPKRGDKRYALERFAALFANSSFMGLPLLSAVMGQESMLYGAIFSGVFLVAVWTAGVFLLGGRSALHWRKALLNPGILGVAVGSLCFAFSVQPTGIAGSLLNYIADLNTPLAMLIAGVFLSQLQLKGIFSRHLVWGVALRCVLLPLALVGAILLLGLGENPAARATVIVAACPTAATAVMMSERFAQDNAYATALFAFSTLISVVTLPLIVLLVFR